MNKDQLGVFVWAAFVLGPAVLREYQLYEIRKRMEANKDGSNTGHND